MNDDNQTQAWKILEDTYGMKLPADARRRALRYFEGQHPEHRIFVNAQSAGRLESTCSCGKWHTNTTEVEDAQDAWIIHVSEG